MQSDVNLLLALQLPYHQIHQILVSSGKTCWFHKIPTEPEVRQTILMENPLSISSLLGLFNLYIVDQVATFFDIPFRKSTFLEPFFFKTIINIGLTDSKYIAACIIIHTFITAGLFLMSLIQN